MGKHRRGARQRSMWVATTDLPRSAAHPFYARLNQILDDAGFDEQIRSDAAIADLVKTDGAAEAARARPAKRSGCGPAADEERGDKERDAVDDPLGQGAGQHFPAPFDQDRLDPPAREEAAETAQRHAPPCGRQGQELDAPSLKGSAPCGGSHLDIPLSRLSAVPLFFRAARRCFLFIGFSFQRAHVALAGRVIAAVVGCAVAGIRFWPALGLGPVGVARVHPSWSLARVSAA